MLFMALLWHLAMAVRFKAADPDEMCACGKWKWPQVDADECIDCFYEELEKP